MANRTLIKNAAHILTMDPRLGEIRNGDLLIEDSRIADVGVNLGQVDARVIDAGNMIVIPGFIDTHRHTWQALVRNIASDWTLAQYFAGIRVVLSPHYTPEDMYLGNLIGALEALDAGITTLLDWSHNNNSPDHADAAIRGLRDAGLRAIFGYGNSAEEWFPVSDLPTNFDDVRRVQSRYFSSDDQLVTLAFAARGEFATMRQTIRDFQEARKLGLRITVHAGSGLWGMNGTLIQLAEQGLLKNDTTYVHCNTLRDEEFKLIGDTGGTASIAPEVELQMGHGFLATLKLLGVGVRPSVSIDVTTSIGGDMFGAMRALLMGTRAVVNANALEERKLVDPLPLMCTDVLQFATIEGARACGLDHKVGSITKGKEADLVLINTDAFNLFPLHNATNAVVEACHVGNVDTVFVAGKIVKEHGRLLGFELRDLRRRTEAAIDGLYSRAGVPKKANWLPEPYRESAEK
jgi:5-methylthioadenosine/S-adenosylhomocysteine deaminase